MDPKQALYPKISSVINPDGKMVSKPLEDMFPLLPRDEFLRHMIIPPLECLRRDMRLISVVTPCRNEEENVREVHELVKRVFADLENYSLEHIFIDNASTDKTVAILREIAADDKCVKVIVNARNFGHIRSPYHAILQANGDAVVRLAGDLQDPPQLIKNFVEKWEQGYKIVLGIKVESEETRIMFRLRGLYYRVLRSLSPVDLVEQFTGFGLYDRQVVEILRELQDPYPYFRGLIADIGFR